MPKQDLTDITVVLDRSGSMESIRADTIGGFNSFLDGQKSTPGSANLTLVQFDNQYEFVHKSVPIADVPPLTPETFVPRGGTALLDAIARTINDTGGRLSAMAEPDRPGNVVFVILTDGEENASREFGHAKVMEMVKHQREVYNWQFVYLGANQDAIKAGASIGIPKANSMTYTTANVGSVMRTMSSKLCSSRMGNKEALAYTDEERAEAVKV